MAIARIEPLPEWVESYTATEFDEMLTRVPTEKSLLALANVSWGGEPHRNDISLKGYSCGGHIGQLASRILLLSGKGTKRDKELYVGSAVLHLIGLEHPGRAEEWEKNQSGFLLNYSMSAQIEVGARDHIAELIRSIITLNLLSTPEVTWLKKLFKDVIGIAPGEYSKLVIDAHNILSDRNGVLIHSEHERGSESRKIFRNFMDRFSLISATKEEHRKILCKLNSKRVNYGPKSQRESITCTSDVMRLPPSSVINSLESRPLVKFISGTGNLVAPSRELLLKAGGIDGMKWRLFSELEDHEFKTKLLDSMGAINEDFVREFLNHVYSFVGAHDVKIHALDEELSEIPKGKRADIWLETPTSNIIIECKSFGLNIDDLYDENSYQSNLRRTVDAEVQISETIELLAARFPNFHAKESFGIIVCEHPHRWIWQDVENGVVGPAQNRTILCNYAELVDLFISGEAENRIKTSHNIRGNYGLLEEEALRLSGNSVAFMDYMEGIDTK